MKYSFLIVAAIMFSNSDFKAQDLPTGSSTVFDQQLDAKWNLKQMDLKEEKWHAALVPGCVHTDLITNGIIQDPFLAMNENECQWVGEKNWLYRSDPFEMQEGILKMEVIRFRFDGLDTYAKVYLNDKLILTADNAHVAWDVDVKDFIKRKGNILEVIFESPLLIGEKRLKEQPNPLPGDGLRAVTRKPQYHYGWDWGPKLVTCGITKPIQIIAYDNARFTDIYLEQKLVSEKKVMVKTTFKIHSLKNETAKVVFEMERTGDTWTSDIELKRGNNIVELQLDLQYPFLWWCNGQGNSNLYQFNAWLMQGENVIDTETIKTGFRSIQLVTEKDSIGESFYFKLNGQPVFVKGANYIPIKYFPGQAKEEDYKKLLQSCKDANFNMLRVWGGGVYEDDRFYELCDEMGIMVWQDFMFACSMYPADSIFVTSVIAEAEQQTIRLRNHPSMALWCGNNENAEGWERWGWQQGLSEKQKNQLWRAYKDVFDLTLKKAVEKNTNLNYWESSPRYGRGDARSLSEGDSHYWGVWHDEEPFEVMQKKIPRFMSEFGMQSFPSDGVVLEMNIGSKPTYDNPGLAQHQKHNRGFKLMDKYMSNWYPEVSHKDLKKYALMTQVVQAEGMGVGIEAQRRNMGRCMGTMYWQLNDVWPAFSWSGIDYKGNHKLLHDYLSLLYAPQLISCEIENDNLKIFWISDNYINDEVAMLNFTIENIDGKIIYTSEAIDVKLIHGASVIYDVQLSKLLSNNSTDNKLIRINISAETSNKQYDRVQKLSLKNSKLMVPEKKIVEIENTEKKTVRKKLSFEFVELK